MASGLVPKTLRDMARDTPVPGWGARRAREPRAFPGPRPMHLSRLPVTELNPFMETGNAASEPF